jgi:hypothetical protein
MPILSRQVPLLTSELACLLIAAVGLPCLAFSGAQSIRDATAGKIVGRQLNTHTVTWQDANEVHPEAARDMRQYLMPTIQLNAKHRVGQWLGYFALDFDDIFLCQSTPVAKHEQSARLWRATTANYTTKLLVDGQQSVTIFRHHERMLKVGCFAPICHDYSPLVIERSRFLPAGRQHRLDGKRHS